MRRNVNLGIMGLVFNSGNKGCAALGYSFVQVLEQVAETINVDICLYIFVPVDIQRYLLKPGYKKEFLPKGNYTHIKSFLVALDNKRFSFICKNAIKKCEVIFDFTAGDSFSDIYGEERFFNDIYYKKMMSENTSLVLGSQTYGPFKNPKVKKAAEDIIKNAYEVFARDQISWEVVKKCSGRDAILTSDIAFELKYNKENNLQRKGKIKVGLNPSGLLWSGGYTKDNQFGLKADYRDYCRRLIEKLLKSKQYEIHLIPHVFTGNPNIIDNDMIACNELKKQFPELIQAPCYELPMEIKAYISHMDLFIGSRMHATIGAVSAGVATIPYSYSRKFEGLYSSLEYPYVISGTSIDTQEALRKTLDWIDSLPELKRAAQESARIATEKNRIIYKRTGEIIKEVCEK